MPYKNAERRALVNRTTRRTRTHSNWRQVVVDCGGVCCAESNRQPCRSVDRLEFHAVYGEGDGRFPGRLLLCQTHHADAHPYGYNTNAPHDSSKLYEDLVWEMELCGGWDGWIAKYELDESRLGCMIPVQETL